MVHSSMLRRQRLLIALGILFVCIVLGFVARSAMRQPQVAEAQGSPQATLEFAYQPFAGLTDNTQDFAWGDMDNDGDLDLAVANSPAWQVVFSDEDNDGIPETRLDDDPGFQESSYVYENVDGQLNPAPVWISAESLRTTAIAWGDVNGDGLLDLALGNNNAPDQIYLNQQGILESTPSWASLENRETEDIAWGDADGDGKLDLLAASLESPVRLYTNLGDTLPITATWESTHANTNHDVEWVHVNEDARPDFVVVGDTGEPCVYLNSADGWRQSADCESNSLIFNPRPQTGQRLTTADFDQDGRTDLAIIYQNKIHLHFNANGRFDDTLEIPSNAASLASGDINHDGLPDLVYANWDGTLRVLINHNGQFEEKFSKLVFPGYGSFALETGDVDQDGLVDIIYSEPIVQGEGQDTGLNVLLLNQTPYFQRTTAHTPLEIDYQRAAATLTDIDNDGHVELALLHDHVLSLNTIGAQRVTPIQSLAYDKTEFNTMAWADFDQDGDSDVALIGSETALFNNVDGQIADEPSAIIDHTLSQWVDVDNDQFPELTQCGHDGVAIVRNQNGMFNQSSMQIVQTSPCERAIWGDIDNDGDADLIVASNKHGAYRKYLYHNDHGQFSTEAVWESADLFLATDLALGDLDNDGDLDLAIATRDSGFLVYMNIGGIFESLPSWNSEDDPTSPNVLVRPNVLLVDFDRNGWVDVVSGSHFYANRNGSIARQALPIVADALDTALSFPQTLIDTRNWDGEQGLLLKASFDTNKPQHERIYHLVQLSSGSQPGSKFAIGLNIADSRIEQAEYHIPYTLLGGAAREVRGYFAVNGGQWQPAIPTADTSTQSVAAGQQTFGWDVHASGLFGNSDNVTFKIEALPALLQDGIVIEPQVGRVTASSQPLSVRGSQVRVLFEGEPAANAIVYRQPAGSSGVGQAVSDASGVPFRTDTQGYLQGHGALAVGDQLVALLPVSDMSAYESPFAFTETGKINLYYMSAAPTETGLDSFVVTEGGVQELVISAENPLLLFDLDLSLEWDASNDEPYMAQLHADLRRTSEVLFDLFNGQVALGEINIYHAKEQWRTADIAIHASSTQRPGAILGGIVTQPLSDTLQSGEVLPDIYRSGQVHMSATWNRFGNTEGTLGEDWPRTLAHELGHYAFFMQDNYYGIVDGVFSTIDCQDSAMTDSYRPDYSELLDADHWHDDDACLQSLNALTTGRSDWETVSTFYPMLSQSTELPFSGPNQLPLDLTQITAHPPNTNLVPLAAPLFYLVDESGQSVFINSGEADAYLFSMSASDKSEWSSIVPLSDPTGRLIRARGARAGDRLCVFHLRAETPRSGCETITQDDVTLQLNQVAANWSPSLDLQLVNTQTLHITATGVTDAVDLHAQLFPTVQSPSQTLPVVTFARVVTGVYTTAITSTTSANIGHLRIWDGAATENSAERVEQFNLGQPDNNVGPPGDHSGGIANVPRQPLAYAPLNAPDNQLLIYDLDNLLTPLTNISLETVSAPPARPSWLISVGKLYRLKASPTATGEYALQFRYFSRQLPAIGESFLQIYYLNEQADTPHWMPLPTNINTQRNEANTMLASGQFKSGIYMLGATLPLPELHAGWNLVGYPLAQTQAVSVALASITDQLAAVYHYDAQQTQWQQHFMNVDAAFAPQINTLTQLEFGKGYWINVTQTVPFNLHPEGSPTLSRNDSNPVASGDAMPATMQPPAIVYGWITTPDAAGQVVAVSDNQSCATTPIERINGQLGFVLSVDAAACQLQLGDTFSLRVGVVGQPLSTYTRMNITIDGEPQSELVWNNARATEVMLSR